MRRKVLRACWTHHISTTKANMTCMDHQFPPKVFFYCIQKLTHNGRSTWCHDHSPIGMLVRKFWRTMDKLHRPDETLQTIPLLLETKILDGKLGSCQDASSPGHQQASKSTSIGVLSVLGPQTCVTISWMGKKHTAVSHRRVEGEIIALDARWRLESVTALQLWDCVSETLSLSDAEGKPYAHTWQASFVIPFH